MLSEAMLSCPGHFLIRLQDSPTAKFYGSPCVPCCATVAEKWCALFVATMFSNRQVAASRRYAEEAKASYNIAM